jgi:hypothetical protein
MGSDEQQQQEATRDIRIVSLDDTHIAVSAKGITRTYRALVTEIGPYLTVESVVRDAE